MCVCVLSDSHFFLFPEKEGREEGQGSFYVQSSAKKKIIAKAREWLSRTHVHKRTKTAKGEAGRKGERDQQINNNNNNNNNKNKKAQQHQRQVLISVRKEMNSNRTRFERVKK